MNDHLSASPRSTEWLLALRDYYCDNRLAARAEAQATGGVAIARKHDSWDIAHMDAFEPLVIGGGL